jgi:hypothetical protein
MLSMFSTAHIAVYDSLADWEPGHLLAELRTGRFTGAPYEGVFDRGNAACYPALVEAATRA